MVTVEQLYKDFGVLADAKEKAGEHKDEYLSILSGVKGGPSERRLASQFITRFFKHFPDLAEQAIDAHLDLCEDQDIAIRKQAIKDLPAFCKDTPEHVPKIADYLTQLLQSEDPGELSVVQSSILTLFKVDAKATLGEMFTHILEGDDGVRGQAIKFLANKLKNVPEEILTKVEEQIITNSKKVLQDVTGGEFVAFMQILSGLKSMNTLQGRQQLVDIVTEQADLDQEFNAADPDNVDRLIQCIKQAMPFFSKNVQSTKFVTYICDHVLTSLSDISNPEEAAEGTTPVDVQLEVLKLFAEMSCYCGELPNPEDSLGKVFDRLLEYMPIPPSEENGESASAAEEPKLQFSHVECLMYGFHQLGRKCPQFLTDAENADRLKDFRVRLQYFARRVQIFIKHLRVTLQGKTGEDLKSEENKIKVVGLMITNNINTLIKDLFHNPPSYKATISLSWKPVGQKAAATVTSPGQKRPGITPITFESDSSAKRPAKGERDRSDRKIYSPPTGKFSSGAGSFPGGRGRGRGFRGGFGRGRGRGWRGNRW